MQIISHDLCLSSSPRLRPAKTDRKTRSARSTHRDLPTKSVSLAHNGTQIQTELLTSARATKNTAATRLRPQAPANKKTDALCDFPTRKVLCSRNFRHEKSRKSNALAAFFQNIWWGIRDSNSYTLRRWNLNPVRLPIPPTPHFSSLRLLVHRRKTRILVEGFYFAKPYFENISK